MFDSGLGGLSVWRAVRELLPDWPIHYVADQLHCPYGPKPLAEIQQYSHAIVSKLVQHQPALIVVACNTATGAAIQELRESWPDIPFVGMEPAIKPAAAASQSGVVGVLATQGTFEGQFFQQTRARYAADTSVLIRQGDGLVELVEDNQVETEAAKVLLRRYLEPMLEANADQIVLGCSHYPFLLARMREIVGDRAQIIDPAPAIARQVQRLIRPASSPKPGPDYFFTSVPDTVHFQQQVERLLGPTRAGRIFEYIETTS